MRGLTAALNPHLRGGQGMSWASQTANGQGKILELNGQGPLDVLRARLAKVPLRINFTKALNLIL